MPFGASTAHGRQSPHIPQLPTIIGEAQSLKKPFKYRKHRILFQTALTCSLVTLGIFISIVYGHRPAIDRYLFDHRVITSYHFHWMCGMTETPKKDDARKRLCSSSIFNWRKLPMLKKSTENGGAISNNQSVFSDPLLLGNIIWIRPLHLNYSYTDRTADLLAPVRNLMFDPTGRKGRAHSETDQRHSKSKSLSMSNVYSSIQGCSQSFNAFQMIQLWLSGGECCQRTLSI